MFAMNRNNWKNLFDKNDLVQFEKSLSKTFGIPKKLW